MGLHIPSLEKLILLSKLLDTTMDYLLIRNSDDKDTLHNPRLIKCLRELEHFQSEDKKVVIKILDGMMLKNRTQGVMTLDEGR